MIVKILNAGSGGQGVLTMGNILANSAMLEDFFVTYLPEYGAAVRGGTANCTVSISDEPIASPIASAPDIVVAMNQPSVIKFINRLHPGGQMIYNADLVEDVPVRGDVDIYPVPANIIAKELGNERSANMVILGALIKLSKFLKVETVNSSIEVMLGSKKKLVESSIKALAAGYDGFPFQD